jgi:phosphomethylpyrimidine synthase
MVVRMTQISEGKHGRITPQMRSVAASEKVAVHEIQKAVTAGRVVIPWNPIHKPYPLGIGKGLRVKVNANIGTSREHCRVAEEVEKAKVAVDAGAHAVMDLSTGGNLDAIRRTLLKTVSVPFGTVPVYQAGIEAIEKHGSLVDMTEDDMFSTFEKHAKQGVDFAVVHVGITKESVARLRKQKRLIPMVSRGGAFHMAWIRISGTFWSLRKRMT